MNETPNKDDLLEPLKVALKLEQEGKRLFTEAARRVTGTHARQTFEFLQAEEDRHIDRIRKHFESIEQSGTISDIDLDETEAERKLSHFNRELARLRHEIRPSTSDIEAYRFALEFENGAEEFYERKLQETDDPKVVRFYRWLIREERMHSRLLQSCLRFAEDPAGWFKDHEEHD
jgi:rubrerythrin